MGRAGMGTGAQAVFKRVMGALAVAAAMFAGAAQAQIWPTAVRVILPFAGGSTPVGAGLKPQ